MNDRLATDPAEHHFGNGRVFVGGSRCGVSVAQWRQADTKSGLAQRANFDTLGNNKYEYMAGSSNYFAGSTTTA